MPDIPLLTGLLVSVKAATEIAKSFSDASITKAETKLKVAELISSLADAKIAAVDLQELVQEKEKEIARLVNALALKSKVLKFDDAYYEQDAEGKPKGDPFCLRCWEIEGRLIHIVLEPTSGIKKRICPKCKAIYSAMDSQRFSP